MTILCGVYFVISLFFWKVNFLEPQILPENNILVYILKETNILKKHSLEMKISIVHFVIIKTIFTFKSSESN